MRVALDYRLENSFGPRDIDWSAIEVADLRYRLFVGDQIVLINEADFSARWGWVPILDFAKALTSIAESLNRGSPRELFVFTESEAEIAFARDGDRVRISSNYSHDNETVSLAALNLASEAYERKVFDDALAAHPELGRNQAFDALRLGR